MKKLLGIAIFTVMLLTALCGCNNHYHVITKIEYKEPTCTEDGHYEYWQCFLCDKIFIDQSGEQETLDIIIPATGHSLVETEKKDATCTENGNIAYWQCSSCGKMYLDEECTQEITDVSETVIPATGHNPTEVKQEKPTCTEDGNKAFWHCSLCDKNYTDKDCTQEITNTVIPSSGHSLTENAYKAPTCTEDGNYAFWHCSLCDKNYTDEDCTQEITNTVIPSSGHSLTENAYKAPTCTEDGNYGYWHCSVCNKNYTGKDCTQEITNTVIPSSGHDLKYEYDYDNKEYSVTCKNCDLNDTVTAGDTKDLPILARDENELTEIISNAADGCFIQLANDVTVTSSNFNNVLRIPDGGALDLGGHTVTVKNNGGFVVEGTNVTLQNGSVVTDFANPKAGYALFIGDMGDNNSVTVKNISSKGGFNVFNCVATLYDCEVDSSNHTYYALWADEHSTINVESGTYLGGEIACVHSTAGEITDGEDGRGIINIKGGLFHGAIMATDLTVISGGEFDGDIMLTPYNSNGTLYQAQLIVSKDYNSALNIVADESKYDVSSRLDENGDTVYITLDK